jgi:hypothetical protein
MRPAFHAGLNTREFLRFSGAPRLSGEING